MRLKISKGQGWSPCNDLICLSGTVAGSFLKKQSLTLCFSINKIKIALFYSIAGFNNTDSHAGCKIVVIIDIHERPY